MLLKQGDLKNKKKIHYLLDLEPQSPKLRCFPKHAVSEGLCRGSFPDSP